MARQGVERRLAAILSADVVGYGRLMGEDEAGALARLKARRAELVDPTIAGWYQGRIVKMMGDSVLVAFPSVVDAVGCAVRRPTRHGRGDAILVSSVSAQSSKFGRVLMT